MLRADHKVVSALFADYEKARSKSRKRQLVARICTELSVHTQVEEEIFYPAVKRACATTSWFRKPRSSTRRSSR
jgi:hemerythrin superfamily protein